MTLIRTTLAVAIATFGITFASNTAQAGSFEHIDELAGELQGLSSKLAREFRDHYRHSPGYRHLAADAREMRKLAGHIHEIAHYEGDLHHIHDDLHELEELFHHVDGLVDEIEHEAEHGHGHVHGDTRHVRRILRDMDGALHHMLEDVEEMNHGSHGGGHEDDHGHDDHGHAGGGVGFSIGGGSSRTVIRFGFGG